MEQHLIYKMIQGVELNLTQKDLTLLSPDFIRYYRLINKMKTQHTEVTMDNLEINAILEEITIDLDFPKENKRLPDSKLEQATRLYINKLEKQEDADKMVRLISEHRAGDHKALESLKTIVDSNITKANDSTVLELNEVMSEQIEWINNIRSGKDLDGVYLYSENKRKLDQFMKLSYRLKYIEKSDLVVVAGRPSVGKTAFSLALANNFAQNGYKGMFFSLEMTNAQLMHRMATAKSGISNNKFYDTRTPLSDRDYSEYMLALKEVSELPIKVIDKPPTNWLAMKDIIIEHKDEIDYVIIDHLNIIASYDGAEYNNANLMIGKITGDMKRLARDIGVPIILLTQFSRAVGAGSRKDDRYLEPFMRDLRDSGSIEQDADKILLLYRKDEKQEIRDVYERNGSFKVVCKIEKNRSGSTGKVEYMFYANMNRWKEV